MSAIRRGAKPGLSPKVVDFEKEWAALSEGFLKLFNLQTISIMPLIESVYSLCTATPKAFTEPLYNKVKELVADYAVKTRANIERTQSDALKTYCANFRDFTLGSELANHVLRYLNQHWVKSIQEQSKHRLGNLYQGAYSPEVFYILTLCLNIWRDHVYFPLKDVLAQQAMQIVREYRDGKHPEANLVTGLSKSLTQLGSTSKNRPFEIYQQGFESRYMAETAEYYTRQGTEFLEANGVSEFLIYADNRVTEEEMTGKRFLDLSSLERAKKEVVSALVLRHRDSIVLECHGFLTANRLADLKKAHILLSKLEPQQGLEPLASILEDWVAAKGLSDVKCVTDEGDVAQHYVETLVRLHHSAAALVKEAFGDDPLFISSMDKACRRVVNTSVIAGKSSAEMLAHYCDLLLKKGKLSVDEAQLEEKLGDVLSVFKYLEEKDVFQHFYSKNLGRRLITGSSTSEFSETFMINGLKQVCGFEYVNKLTKMFTDISVSAELSTSFRDFVQDSQKTDPLPKLDFNVQILTTGSWQIKASNGGFIIPSEIARYFDLFGDFYGKRYQGRKLFWAHSYDRGEIRFNGAKRPYDLQASGYQMAVLLLLNNPESPKITQDTVQEATGLIPDEAVRALRAFTEAKVIVKRGDGYTMNTAFASKRLKVRIGTGAAGGLGESKEGPPATGSSTLGKSKEAEEDAETRKGVDEDRKIFLQAAIVRTMKARKELKHVQLVQEVITQAKGRFQPSVAMIKKCIEILIEKEYLKRSEAESDKYTYIA